MDNPASNSNASDTNTTAQISRRELTDTLCTLGIEFIFVMIPLLFIFLVMAFHGHLGSFWSDFEWSFVAAVLFGLTMVKLVSGSLSGKSQPRWQPIVLLFAIVLIGMLANLILLSMAYSEHLPQSLVNKNDVVANMNNITNTPNTRGTLPDPLGTHSKSSIAATQGIFFVISCLTFFVIGGYGQLRLTRAESGK